MASREAPARGLSPGGALVALMLIERSLDAFCASAPLAAAEIGGREALLAASEMTCVGPVPRLTESDWEGMAAEHAEAQREEQRNTGRGVAAGGRPGPEGATPPPRDRAGGLLDLFRGVSR